ncbi:hypothetical protein F5B20DRAFT_579570 [Whalleya microplaca]|nr:hypothetical protein F5B20DRAFT_579570 [Whalleya microplaca]
MYFATTAAVLFSLLTLSTQTNFKADEFSDGNCQNRIYGHISNIETTMDDKSNSVYLATSDDEHYQYQAYSGKTKNGGKCTGDVLGNMTTGGADHSPCYNLNDTFDRRIKLGNNVANDDQFSGGKISDRNNASRLSKLDILDVKDRVAELSPPTNLKPIKQ